ncbi:MAG: TAXI family TRAP transporter solute-binding subunit, partial [Prolixibacteraceae bacterium]|nr:TAXI family TRAP transporter solute-binding subunit [Prolixibacteraceae bacterium]
PQFLNFGEAVTALKDRIVDCAVVAAGVPTSAVVDVSTSLDVRLVDLDTKVMEEFLKDRPFLHITQIPKGTYRGIDVDVSAAASPALLVARDDVKDEMVYAITKAIFDNLDTIVASHVQGKMLKLETALNAMSIPLHPGAEKYYKEMGVLK